MSRLKELREERAKVHADFVVLANKPGITAEDRENCNKMEARVTEITTDIDRVVRAEKLEAELRGSVVVDPIVDPTREAPVAEKRAAFRRSPYNPAKVTPAETSYRNAFADYLQFGNPGNKWQRGCTDEQGKLLSDWRMKLTDSRRDHETRDQEAGTQSITYTQGTLGGYFVPAGFVYDIEVATKYFAPLLDGSTVKVFETATGQVLPYPTSNDTNQAWTILGESTSVSDNGTSANYPTVGSAPSANPGNVLAGQITLNAWKGTTGLVRVSLELLQDSAFNIESYLANAFAIRLGRGYEYYLTNGSGTNQPKGIITAVQASGASPITAIGSSSNDGNAANTGANSIGTDDLINLEHSVDPTYRRGAKYMFHDDTLRFLRTMKDKFGRPLWQPSVKDGDVDTINGYPYVINQSISKIAASATSVVFGDFSKFLVRKVRDLQILRLDERYADFGEVAFVAFSRIDSQLIDAGTHPLNTLLQHS